MGLCLKIYPHRKSVLQQLKVNFKLRVPNFNCIVPKHYLTEVLIVWYPELKCTEEYKYGDKLGEHILHTYFEDTYMFDIFITF